MAGTNSTPHPPSQLTLPPLTSPYPLSRLFRKCCCCCYPGRKGIYGVPVGVITLVKCVLDMAKTKGFGSMCSAKCCNRRRKAKCNQLEDRSDGT